MIVERASRISERSPPMARMCGWRTRRQDLQPLVRLAAHAQQAPGEVARVRW
jgi:hypothetical protein